MKRITFLMTGLLVLMLACDNPVNVPEDAPDVFRELVTEEYRIDAKDVNALVYATFVVDNVGGNTGSQLYILGSKKDDLGDYIPEDANFPGKGKVLPGECIGGKWFNSQGKPTAGSIPKPHPHCVDVREGTESYHVVLEMISAHYNPSGESSNATLVLGKNGSVVRYIGNNQEGSGEIVAWGIREDTDERVGHFTIELDQFENETHGTGQNKNENLFDCSLDGDDDQDGCLNKTIVATYRHGTNGEGEPTDVEGFLYWFLIPSIVE